MIVLYWHCSCNHIISYTQKELRSNHSRNEKKEAYVNIIELDQMFACEELPPLLRNNYLFTVAGLFPFYNTSFQYSLQIECSGIFHWCLKNLMVSVNYDSITLFNLGLALAIILSYYTQKELWSYLIRNEKEEIM